MKKILFTLATIALISASASAQKVKVTSSVGVPVKTIAAHKTLTHPFAVSANRMSSNSIAKVQKKAESDQSTWEALYNIPSGSLYDGIPADFGSTYNYVHMPALKDLKIYNYSDTAENVTFTFTDKYNSLTYVTDANGNTTFNGWGSYIAPTLTATLTDGTSKSFTYSFTGGTNVYPAVFIAGSEAPDTLSNAHPWAGMYTGFTNGPSTYAKETFYNTGKKAVGFAEYYAYTGTSTYVEGIYLVLAKEGSHSDTPFDGKEMKATIYTFDDNGSLVEYASATASEADLTYYEGSYTSGGDFTRYYVPFVFKDEDPTFGVSAAPILLPDDDFIIICDGFGDLTTSYACPFAPATDTQKHYYRGYGYILLEDGSLSTVGYSNNPSTPQINLHIGLLGAAMPTAEVASDTAVVTFPTDGGYGEVAYTSDEGTTTNYNDLLIYTTFENWEVESKPDWISEVTIDSSTASSNYYIDVTPKADALTDGTGRTGNIVLATDYLKTVTIVCNQGDVTGINSAIVDNAVKSNGAIYNLAGQRVTKNAKGILIQNGKKFINR